MEEPPSDIFDVFTGNYSTNHKCKWIRSGMYSDQLEQVRDIYDDNLGRDLTVTPFLMASFNQPDPVVNALLNLPEMSCQHVSIVIAQFDNTKLNAFALRYDYTLDHRDNNILLRILRCFKTTTNVLNTEDTLLSYLFNVDLTHEYSWNDEPTAKLIIEILKHDDCLPMEQFHDGFSPFIDAITYADTRTDILTAFFNHPDVKKYLVYIYTRTIDEYEINDIENLCDQFAINPRLPNMVYNALHSMPATRHITKLQLCMPPVTAAADFEQIYTGDLPTATRHRKSINHREQIHGSHRIHIAHLMPQIVASEISDRFVHPDEQGRRIPKRLGGNKPKTNKPKTNKPRTRRKK